MEEKKEMNIVTPEVVPEISSLTSFGSEVGNQEKSEDELTTSPTISTNAPNLMGRASKLTNKNRSFLEHLMAGKSTLEAYRLAGYNGKGDAPYQLRLRLKEQLKNLLESEGLDRNGLKIKVKRMLELGLDPEVRHLSPKMYLETLRFVDKLLEKEAESSPVISPFIIQTDTVNISESK